MTNEQLNLAISKRAVEQFSRDMWRLGMIMSENNGKISVADMQKILATNENKKVGFLRKLFKFSANEVMSEVDDDKYYLLQLAFKCMDVLSVNELNLADLDAKKLRPLYMKFFKKEYEEYERYQYRIRDLAFKELAISEVIRADKLQLSDENEI